MSVKHWMKNRLNQLLRQYGSEIVSTEMLYEWQRFHVDEPRWNKCDLPGDAARYLRPDNPELIKLEQRYRAFDSEVTTPLVWTDYHVRPEDIAYFRGDNAWVWQVRGKNANLLAYALTLYYLKSIDRLGLFERLSEDDKFGNFTFTIAGRKVSRDLLDSIAEIYFLDRHLGVGSRAGLRVLDVGAGYGRLAHRMVNALPGTERFFCTDAVAVSTFVSDYYLRFRGVEKALVIPLDEVDSMLRDHPVDLAINIHSFSECREQAIEWWTRLLSKHRVKHLMVVPNRTANHGEGLLTNDGHDFLPLLERYGYRTVAKEPKFTDPVVQEYGLKPGWHHLLELQR
ncbi:MAG: putative sugar O-methyltransferase [Candidatus Sulfotelmatobacter sp.]